MKFFKLAFLVFFFFASSNAFSQNQDIARAYYIKAKEAYASEQYSAVIDYLRDAKNELGSTNPDIIYLELMSKYNRNKKDPQVGELAMDFINSADRSDDRIQEVSLLAVEHKKLIEAGIKKEQDLYNRAVNTRSLRNLRRYIEVYPGNGERTRKVEELIHQKDEQQFLQARASNTVKDLEQYKTDFPRGQYLTEANRLLETAREEELYAKARRNDDTQLYKSYLIQYPNGTYANEVSLALEAAMINEANSEFEEEQYSIAKNSYQNYRRQFPSGAHLQLVESRLNEIQKIEKKEARISKRRSSKYFMFTYSTAEEYGLEQGGLHLNNVATYFSMSANKNVLNLKFTSDEQAEVVHEEFEEATLSASFGLTYKITYPLWIYAGGGVTYTEYFWEDESETLTFEIVDQTPYQFYPEAGLQVKLGNAFVLKAGAVFMDGEVIYKAGLGF